MTIIQIQCECGTWTPVNFKKQFGIFAGICPNNDCQIENRMRVIQIETEKNVFESITTDIKECRNCGKKWVEKHSCKGNQLGQQKEIMRLVN